jgi:type IV pilus assembly protein PilP
VRLGKIFNFLKHFITIAFVCFALPLVAQPAPTAQLPLKNAPAATGPTKGTVPGPAAGPTKAQNAAGPVAGAKPGTPPPSGSAGAPTTPNAPPLAGTPPIPGAPLVPGAPSVPAAAAIPGAPTVAPTNAPNAAGVALTPTDELSEILEEFKYDPAGRRDPFMSYVPNRGNAVGSIGPTMPLQKYDLERLKLVGVMWDVRDPRALVKVPSQEVFTIHKDSRIGNRNGYVAQIRSGEIIVVETIESSGKVMYQTRIIRVAKDDVKGPR